MLVIADSLKQIPIPIRINFNCLIIFEIPSDKELQFMYEDQGEKCMLYLINEVKS
jgi:hypothetical protein